MNSNNRVADAKTFRDMIVPSSAGIQGLADKTAEQQPQNQTQPQPQPQQQPLKCPRCESCNTKFCYYNNYSLSQPRYFCKACKRYWTRGGTLRNVPVGGSCRKNKRVKRPTIASAASVSSASSNSGSSSSTALHNPQISHSYANPLFYGLSNMSGGNNLPLMISSSRFGNSKASGGFGNDFVSGGFNGLNNIGLGFPHVGDHINSSMSATNKPFFSGLFGSLSSSSTPSMATLLADHNIPRNSDILGQNHLQTLASLQDLQVEVTNNEAPFGMINKEGKLDHQVSGYIGLSSDPSNYNPNAVGAWFDPTNNVGSSLTYMI